MNRGGFSTKALAGAAALAATLVVLAVPGASVADAGAAAKDQVCTDRVDRHRHGRSAEERDCRRRFRENDKRRGNRGRHRGHHRGRGHHRHGHHRRHHH